MINLSIKFRNNKKYHFFLLTASSKPLPVLNLTTFLAFILIVSPVAGFLPSLAALRLIENVPKPGKVNLSPDFKHVSMLSKTVLTTSVACTLLNSADVATDSIKSPFVIIFKFVLIYKLIKVRSKVYYKKKLFKVLLVIFVRMSQKNR